MAVPLNLVHLRITDVALLTHLLRFPEGTSLEGSYCERSDFSRGSVAVPVLVLDIPGAPEGAQLAEPVYELLEPAQGEPDPVVLSGVRWYRADGTLIETSAGDP